MSSDMARPVVVTDVTAATGAGFGPVQNHGLRSYSLGEGDVKAQRFDSANKSERARRLPAETLSINRRQRQTVRVDSHLGLELSMPSTLDANVPM